MRFVIVHCPCFSYYISISVLNNLFDELPIFREYPFLADRNSSLSQMTPCKRYYCYSNILDLPTGRGFTFVGIADLYVSLSQQTTGI